MTDENQKDENQKKENNQKQEDITLDDLESKIEELKNEDKKNEEKEEKENEKIEELKNALARSMADLQNYKRRTEEDQGKFVRFANGQMLKELLPVVDNFNRCTEHLPEELKENEWSKGVVQIHDNLNKTLEKIGVKKIETVGKKLNPNEHDALMAGPGEKDMIIEEFEPGYTLNGDVIKAAKVKVGDGTK